MDDALPKMKVRCRAIAASDLDAVAGLLCQGFPGRSRAYWLRGLGLMAKRDVPGGCQRFGYVLDTGGRITGVILLIPTTRTADGGTTPFINVASWYVTPEFRAYGQLLASVALRNKDATYLNISAAPHTWPIVEQQGYTKYCSGLFFAFAPLAAPVRGVTIERVEGRRDAGDITALASYAMLRRHVEYGCTVIVCRESAALHPFIFQRYAVRSGRVRLPAVQALYAPSQGELIRLAGTLGRYLMRRGAPIVVMDADGPIAGLQGVFTERRGRKYFKGPHRPALCDLSDTEFAIFGI